MRPLVSHHISSIGVNWGVSHIQWQKMFSIGYPSHSYCKPYQKMDPVNEIPIYKKKDEYSKK